jgi:hypothetical protein
VIGVGGDETLCLDMNTKGVLVTDAASPSRFYACDQGSQQFAKWCAHAKKRAWVVL